MQSLLAERLILARKLNKPGNNHLRLAAKEMCRKDIFYWADNFAWTLDPRVKPSKLPLVLWPHQRKALQAMLDAKRDEADIVVEKSRDMGVTWIAILFHVWHWQFELDTYVGGIGSRKEDLVDKADDPDSIFEKIRFLIDNQPNWLLPEGYNKNKHDKHMNISNPETGSVIRGEAGNQIGRGGRATAYTVDEAGFIEQPGKVDAALSQNTNCRQYISTPNGNGNPFAQKARAARMGLTKFIRLISMHWKEDPRKNHFEIVGDQVVYPWYEKQKEILRDPVIIAQELDIDYSASIEGIVIPARYVTAAVHFKEWLLLNKGLHMPKGIKMAGYDVAAEGSNDNVLIFGEGPVVNEGDIKSWRSTNPIISADKIINMCNVSGVKFLNFDGDGIGISIAGSLGKASDQGRIKFEYSVVKNGGKCSPRKWVDGVNPDGSLRYKTSKEKFKNPRAENWWILRERFEKTYEYRELGIQHPLHELISIPDHQLLIEQLSSVLGETGEDGKIKLESKEHMLKVRQEPSPDYADALVYLYAPIRKRPLKRTSSSQRTN